LLEPSPGDGFIHQRPLVLCHGYSATPHFPNILEIAYSCLLPNTDLFTDESGHVRCWWCRATPLYRDYHDREWGFPVSDERRLFEKLCLEGFQAGLSWLTILNKREAFRAAMANFEADELACFTAADVERLLGNAGIVRHRGKIESTINNARRVLELRREYGSFAHYIWRYAPQAAQGRPQRITGDALRTQALMLR